MNRSRSARLSALAGKYETLLSLRSGKASGAPLPPKHVFVALNAEFPGALVELDRLAVEALASRAESLRAAARGDEPEVDWMTALDLYHALIRVGLMLRALRRTGDVDEHLHAAAKRLSDELGLAVAAEHLGPMVHPETRRLVPAALDLTASFIEWPRDRVAKLLGRGIGRGVD